MNTRRTIVAFLTASALTHSLTFATDSQPQADPGLSDDYEAPALQGDINGDGMVNIDDVWEVIEAWGAHRRRPAADIFPPEGDHKVDGMDLLLVISNWGA